MRQLLPRLIRALLFAVVRALSSRTLLRLLSNPALAIQVLLKRSSLVPVETKVALDLFDRPTYGYGLWTASHEAMRLGIPAITAIEFGVGSGAGLIALDAIACEIEAATGVTIDVVGFDNGAGLPPPEDYRDLPYVYGTGYYPMDEDELRSRLKRAKLIVGDVKETLPAFLERPFPPVGFVSFDLDYYSSTKTAFGIFDEDTSHYLPRVVCYFDDMSNSEALQCSYTGEALAIREFNGEHEDAKIDRIYGLRGARLIDATWPDMMFACHSFRHPLYNSQIVAEARDYVPPLVS